ncbi:MAG: hypothetical protein OSA98_20205 [Rubripirellula sp.]|nr:hypothetical protein [Rubripirellula sp.]
MMNTTLVVKTQAPEKIVDTVSIESLAQLSGVACVKANTVSRP